MIHLAQINKHISQAEADKLEAFYLEIIARPEARQFEEREQVEPDLNDEDQINHPYDSNSLETTAADEPKL